MRQRTQDRLVRQRGEQGDADRTSLVIKKVFRLMYAGAQSASAKRGIIYLVSNPPPPERTPEVLGPVTATPFRAVLFGRCREAAYARQAYGLSCVSLTIS